MKILIRFHSEASLPLCVSVSPCENVNKHEDTVDDIDIVNLPNSSAS